MLSTRRPSRGRSSSFLGGKWASSVPVVAVSQFSSKSTKTLSFSPLPGQSHFPGLPHHTSGKHIRAFSLTTPQNACELARITPDISRSTELVPRFPVQLHIYTTLLIPPKYTRPLVLRNPRLVARAHTPVLFLDVLHHLVNMSATTLPRRLAAFVALDGKAGVHGHTGLRSEGHDDVRIDKWASRSSDSKLHKCQCDGRPITVTILWRKNDGKETKEENGEGVFCSQKIINSPRQSIFAQPS
ncbi:hypothetical protein BXZ70DRAFT_936274 [Cristinia sonorae]|uniref:Uncharacterized protein n=1 Tax=Cristinia sonorae TaxID=1940300 RepID=A0A8K0UNF1_9AGAR|nr:hypothetical protein BXZ70DRAFT_936274 [Cristinia sonorae]